MGSSQNPRATWAQKNSLQNHSGDSSYSVKKHSEYEEHSFSRVNKEGQSRLDQRLKEYGDDFEDSLIRYGCNMCLRMEKRGPEYAKEAIFNPRDGNKSALRFYDYEMNMENDKENSYISGSIHVYGAKKVFVAGVESDYSNEERWYSVSDYKKQYPELYKKHYG